MQSEQIMSHVDASVASSEPRGNQSPKVACREPVPHKGMSLHVSTCLRFDGPSLAVGSQCTAPSQLMECDLSVTSQEDQGPPSRVPQRDTEGSHRTERKSLPCSNSH